MPAGRKRADEEDDNPLGMPDELWIDLEEYYERMKKRRGDVDFKAMVDYFLDSPFGKDWFENEYRGGNEYNLRVDLEEAFSEKEGEMEATGNRRRAKEPILEIEKADEEMLGKMFANVLKELKNEIMGQAWDAAEHIAQEGPHIDRLIKVVMDEGFADNENDAFDIVLDLGHLWLPDVSAMIREGVEG